MNIGEKLIFIAKNNLQHIEVTEDMFCKTLKFDLLGSKDKVHPATVVFYELPAAYTAGLH